MERGKETKKDGERKKKKDGESNNIYRGSPLKRAGHREELHGEPNLRPEIEHTTLSTLRV